MHANQAKSPRTRVLRASPAVQPKRSGARSAGSGATLRSAIVELFESEEQISGELGIAYR